jgi:uncharacterized Zn finger protein
MSPSAPTITNTAIAAWISEPYLSRGRKYAQQNAIFAARRTGPTISARCYGSSEPYYRVSATLTPAGAVRSAGCTCPVGDGGHCKHVAALLFTYSANPQTFPEVEDLNARLEGMAKADLIALIKRMLAAEPELEDLLELQAQITDASPVNADLIQRRVAAAARNAGDDWNAIETFAANLRPIRELADAHLRRDNIGQAALIFAVLPLAALEYYGSFDDESGALHGIVNECVHGLSECLAVTEAAEQRRLMLQALFAIRRWDLEFGGIDMGAEADDIIDEQATPAEARIVAAWVEQALTAAAHDQYGAWKREAYGRWLIRLMEKGGNIPDDAAALRIARASDQPERAVELLLGRGQITEALAEAQHVPDHRLSRVADVLWNAGHQEHALELMQRRGAQNAHYFVYSWLDEHLERVSDPARALAIAVQVFNRAPTVERYQRLVRLAEPTGEWPKLRAEVLARLQGPNHYDLLAQLHLAEGAPGDAVEIAGAMLTGSVPNLSILTSVAEAAEATYPADAAWLYNRIAELLIARQNRPDYAEAAAIIRRLRDLHQRQGRANEAQAAVNHFRSEYKRFRAFQEELSRAGIP